MSNPTLVRPAQGRRRRGFTLIELLVVCGIIVLLLSILMPAVGKARDAVNGVVCESHIRTLTQAFLSFAADHDNRLPGSRYAYWTDRNADHWDWLYGQYSMYANENHTMYEQLETAPQYGTIFKYVKNYDVYRCPALQRTTPGCGYGSNGRFDYAAFCVFEGAPIRDIALKSQLYFPVDPTLVGSNNPRGQVATTDPVGVAHQFSQYKEDQPTPIVCQEDPLIAINSTIWAGLGGHGTPDGQHGGIKQMAHLHGGGSWYGSIDGSTVWIDEPDYIKADPQTGIYPDEVWETGAGLWFQNGPVKHKPIRLWSDWNDPWDTSFTNPRWGYWSHQ